MENYNDYVIKDGKYIGKFEEMYKKFDNPWNQTSKEYHKNSYSRNTAIINIRRYKINSLVEFGCGLGYYTSLLAQETGIKILGVDISHTAITKAKKLWPDLNFAVDSVINIRHYTDYEAILFAEIAWYILNDLDKIFDDMLKYFPGKYFIHNLVFYKGQQKYGNEYFTNLKEFINYIPFKLIAYSEATEEFDDIETSTIFKIEKKCSHDLLKQSKTK